MSEAETETYQDGDWTPSTESTPSLTESDRSIDESFDAATSDDGSEPDATDPFGLDDATDAGVPSELTEALSAKDADSDAYAPESEAPEADPDETQEQPTIETEQPEEPQVNPYILQQAAKYNVDTTGLGEAEITRILTAIESMGVQPVDAKAGEAETEEKPTVELPTFDLPEETLENMDDDSRKLFETMRDQMRDAVQAMAQQQEQLTASQQEQLEAYQRQEQIRTIERFDEFCNADESLKSILGNGASGEMAPGSTEIKNRTQVFDQMAIIADGRAVRGLPPIPEKELFQQALATAFPKHVARQAKEELKQKVTKRESQLSVRPTKRQIESESLSPEELARQNMERVAKDRGITIPWN